MSIIVPLRHTGIGAWVKSKMFTSILYNFINFHARVLYKHTEYTGSLGYNSVCYITSRIRWVFKEKSVVGCECLPFIVIWTLPFIVFSGVQYSTVQYSISYRYLSSRSGDFRVL